MDNKGLSRILREFESEAHAAVRSVPWGVSAYFTHKACRGTAIARRSSGTGRITAKCIKCSMQYAEENKDEDTEKI